MKSDLPRPSAGEFLGLFGWRSTLRDLRHRPGRAWDAFSDTVREAQAGRLGSVPLAQCIDAGGFAYGAGGFEAYRDLALQLLEDPELSFSRSRFLRFLERVQARNQTELLAFHDPALLRTLPVLPFGSHPWGPLNGETPIEKDRFLDDSQREGGEHFRWWDKGERTRHIARREFDETRTLLDAIARDGYRLVETAGRWPSGRLLQNASGATRFLLRGGTHRTAVLAALGHTVHWVRLDTRRYPPVRESELERWPWVTSGLLPADDARRMFRLYFDLDGSERARALGLVA